ncbi:malto-oligosyltrehalose synthase [Mucilaginibacter limnophilus]|uniref:4-alpha-glucanotransferase n=1 Tax=Mucilaginibacter limnophilus TaxID=1932778 RepID=A0A3S2ULP5_9SPHI|nr:malto-oligosyltrehalose synthase [Mucilaginibacter limnophilus]RVU00787.1 malto-oligosyltrehalose synthase [Mucilaginibacter limnophilus]
MFNPVSTYRIQFNKDFTFKQFKEIISYLKNLGVSTIYASPIFEATPGSTHGYDVLNPHRINPEIGTIQELREISAELKEAAISWVQDIVPNHMAYDPGNIWLMDVLERGAQSFYAGFFDMSGISDLFSGPVMVPFLGDDVDNVLNNGELKVAVANNRLVLKYYDSAYPLKISSYADILGKGETNEAITQLARLSNSIKDITEAPEYNKAADEFLLQFKSLLKNKTVSQAVNQNIEAVNFEKEFLQKLVNDQYYRLCNWQQTDSQINFRRFFTVNGLICLNIQEKHVFDYYHKFIQSLLKEGIFQGLRVDHIDGLYDPVGYLQDLRRLAGDEVYIVVEKILENGEQIPSDWPIQGNTGYDFLAIVNNLLTDKQGEEAFTDLYKNIGVDTKPIEEQIWDKKGYILHNHMAGELDNLTNYFIKLNLPVENQQVAREKLKAVIARFLVYCLVYRYYGNSFPLAENEAKLVQQIFERIRERDKDLSEATEVLENALLKRPRENDITYNESALKFYQRCMQLTGPLMAKGVEDTLMYTYNRFIGHNEVGDAPESFGLPVDDFHDIMQERLKLWPLSMNGTSTHDTKRGEDVRARLNVLTAAPELWERQLKEWQEIDSNAQSDIPDANDKYLIYQTLLGAYPMPGQGDDNFAERVHQYLEKALREAKVKSNWTAPNEKYEAAAKNFATGLLEDETFRKSFDAFHAKIADHGIINSLAQVILKFTCPGTPDIYQGCERWDLSLVDPDNRRPVDYQLSNKLLTELEKSGINQLWNERYNAKIKLWLSNLLLNLRKQNIRLFEKGEYVPLKVKGKYKENILAFTREQGGNRLIVIIPLYLISICEEQQTEINNINWKNTRVILPGGVNGNVQNLLTGDKVDIEEELTVGDIFTGLPFALLLQKRPENPRGAGILMHISSLPSAYGIGDFGPEAKQFADFLNRANLKYWQLLPLSPIEEGAGFSPYSSFSSMGGNTFFINPEMLAEDRLISTNTLKKHRNKPADKADYHAAETIRDEVFEEAWTNFKNNNSLNDLDAFCEKENAWLNDLALYVVLKKYHGGKPWYQWQDNYKLRDEKALKSFAKKHQDEIQKTRWLQFVFSRQWNGLKQYCNSLSIKIIGDMPFYVSYDSVDVWANPEIFSLDENGDMVGMAGVPPDYFNENGQLWGMPVFRWDKVKETGYKWWIQRIRKNIELFDIVRLDHFRAFSTYWEVPAGEETAKNGKWVQGPGSDFFITMKNEFGKLPFIAEDLGDVDDAVFELRDEFDLPGMRVLQFAFGDDMPNSEFIPHNYIKNTIAYTGTHDNNTTKGWYRQDTDKHVRKQVKQYTHRKVNEGNIHEVLNALALSSVAETVILPVQDVIGLDETARMNMPSSVEGNWLWRLLPKQLEEQHEVQLKQWVWMYNRY